MSPVQNITYVPGRCLFQSEAPPVGGLLEISNNLIGINSETAVALVNFASNSVACHKRLP